MAVGLAGLEEGIITPDFQRVTAPAARPSTAATFKCWKKGGHGIDRPAARDRAVVQRVLLHRRQHARRRQDPQVGDAARPRREDAASTCRTRSQGLVPSTEWKQRALQARSGTPARRFRSSIGQGQVSVTPVSMAVYMATLANGGTRVTPHLLQGGRRRQRLEAGAGAAAAVDRSTSRRRSCRRSATACGWSSTAAAPAAAPGSRATTSAARPARRR